MNWEKLFRMQKQLDSYIQTTHQLESVNLFDKKVLALLVEVGELANETRCFKFWSNKAPSEQSVILEEYVDGLHFILSLGLEKEYSYNKEYISQSELSVTDVFNTVFEQIIAFKQDPSKEKFTQLFQQYISLGSVLGFSEEDIQTAYFDKNKINHERQNQGY
ncbi:dUTP diphosphatase [Aquibacillus albus]|uniref:Dimeric dUTPase (All-alpha-NTP-PPase superfamily) n=1 Tax=Aquibacillus albus TaxID=1168171 RepID=A0ABS2N1M0_9BACI|nr:dUTP diphosphatase [Aquibacillus albus]MBM7571968.1 dimeric dUTPase (all-alpha-NTP-PPase superfamily) [Aquibacillus albus]